MTGAGYATPESGRSLDTHRVACSLLSIWNSVAPKAKASCCVAGVGGIVSPPKKRHGHILTPGPCDCGLIWKKRVFSEEIEAVII